MALRKVFLLLICLGSYFLNYSQTKSAGRDLVVIYDPLFWKDKLKLDVHQYHKIRDINSEFYQKILSDYKAERNNRSDLKLKAEQSLLDRSQRIWETFHPKQRKIWMKMFGENAS